MNEASAARRTDRSPARAMSIGEVLSRLREDFPDVSISKIRFLEEQGLVEPQRTPSGYRKFTHADVERLRYVLSVQRDHYLPLRVIRTHLEALEQGEERPLLETRLVTDADARPSRVRLDRDGLCRAADVSPELLAELESYGVLAAPGHGGYDDDAVIVARTAGELSRFGIEPRHLRPFRVAAEREASLVEQVVAPLRRRGGPEAAGRAEETSREVASLCVRLHAALVKDALDSSGE